MLSQMTITAQSSSHLKSKTDVSFSVIIPSFNRSELLCHAIESVLEQDDALTEVIVVDDGSTEDLSSVVKAYGGRVKYVRTSNGGPAAARNVGAARAHGAYLAFLDSDDVLLRWSLQTYRRVIEEHRYPSFVTASPVVFREQSALAAITNDALVIEEFEDYYSSSDAWRWHGASSFLVRRETFSTVGGFHSAWTNSEDADLALRLGTAPGYISIRRPITFGYREHQSQATSNIARTISGLTHIVNEERQGHYPGGAARARQRREIIARHVRPASLEAARAGYYRDAGLMFRNTAMWNLREGRLRYLLAFPAIAIIGAVRPRKR
jgi:glycosyltransferase involved in cell wall biosynthesis